ncbi:hypothetical protein [Carboxylicivirga linearis]|uniref:Uncharacterized protein n=1 Tax=Carboxylicivirga linearis TaxID=1628157 RepID=A0ABS5JXQ2_9BACT|nr:hypothetical protein [Carboxylicivirga linearis]MBS2099613.1 hypothetical protein [Carboxylicivirga linearis]
MTKSDFWLLSADTILVIPGEKIIIGTLSEYNDDKKIVDRYEDGDKIESFDLYIDNVKSNIDFSTRKYWTFETGLVDQSAIYILNINEETIKLD